MGAYQIDGMIATFSAVAIVALSSGSSPPSSAADAVGGPGPDDGLGQASSEDMGLRL
jgi:hypothetical protein